MLFAIPSLAGGGAERVFLTLLRHLSHDRFEPHLLLLLKEGPLVSSLPADLPVHVVGSARLRHGVPRLRRLVSEVRPDVVLSTQGYLNMVFLLLGRWLPPTRLVVREVIGEQYLEGHPFRHAFYRLYQQFCRSADRIVLQSDQARADFVRDAPFLASRAVRIYNPIDLNGVANEARGRPSPFARDRLQVVAAGRLTHQKGYDLLLAAFARVLAAGVRAHLTILGDGPLRTTLLQRRDELQLGPHVDFAGFVQPPYHYYANADLFALSSRYEGLPNALLEALACGCPAVAADCRYGVSEIVQDGVNGRLVPPERVDPLADAMTAVLRDSSLRGRLRAAARGSVARFSLPQILQEWETLFDDAL